MKICIDVSPAVHQRAGQGRYTQELVTALLAVDQDNEYIALYNRPAEAYIAPPLDGITHYTSDLGNKLWRMSALVAHFARISQDGLVPNVDLFHATDHLLPRFDHVPSVFTLHDIIFRSHPETHKPLNRWFLSLMIPRFLRRAAAVIAVSECTKQDAVRWYGIDESKFHVIYEGVDPRFQPADPMQVMAVRHKYDLPEHFILAVGTIEPRKNLTRLLEAYHRLRDRHAGLKLVIVGRKGWLYDSFFRRLREMGLENEVIFPGYVTDEDLPVLYGAASVFVFPSLYEGFGLPVLEAMACGVPVVCSNASSIPEVAGDAALLIDPLDVPGMVTVLERALTDADLVAAMRQKGLAQAARFSWEKTARETLGVYQRVMERSKRTASYGRVQGEDSL